jgi:L-ascorbate metabolism protein UlaG (beta-lactamase superfamily)
MIIQRLNMDNSWHIQFSGKSFLIDPWLKGVEIDFFSWFNKQWHRTPPLNINDVPAYDVVIITQKYPDHFHPETLIELNPKKLIVPKSIGKKVRQLLPDAEVLFLDSTENRKIGTDIKLHYLASKRKIDPIYDAIVLEDGNDSILIATHGYTESQSWTKKILSLPPIKLALTPFNLYKLPFFLGGTVSPGLDAVKDLVNKINPKHILATHDEDKHARGIVNRLAKITFSPSSEVLAKDNLFKDRLITINNYESITL